MLASWIIGLLIFGYAGFMLFRHIKQSKKGKCATCALKDSCSTKEYSCCTGVNTSEETVIEKTVRK
ncbi:FeoB-associated Cys-rich membrane protein [Lentibacillus saliphilus]|uniref:FeoB-associated Cys-rich membrane protein n=1 Tax=Lentibacillus saliphilus TaxID=2737028 RepID=UPI001C305405|nr:FeoB-associated Cys-rich membrane protein [Lentibacillus saliphilus]